MSDIIMRGAVLRDRPTAPGKAGHVLPFIVAMAIFVISGLVSIAISGLPQ